MCVKERERERERVCTKERERESECECNCMHMCARKMMRSEVNNDCNHVRHDSFINET